MNERAKKPFGAGKIILIVLAAVVGIPLVGGCLAGLTGGRQLTPGIPSVEVAKAEPFELVPGSYKLDRDSADFLHAKGKIVNNSTEPLRYLQVKVEGLDSDGARVDTAVTNTSDLAPGQVWAFDLVLMKKEVATLGELKIGTTPGL